MEFLLPGRKISSTLNTIRKSRTLNQAAGRTVSGKLLRKHIRDKPEALANPT